MSNFQSTKLIELGSCAFRQWRANPQLATSGLVRNDSKCFYVHGYQLKAKFIFNCSSLDERNWVMDFGSLKPLKTILNEQFDHTLCIAADDPQLDLFKNLHEAKACDLRIMNNGVGIEKTAEWCFIAADKFVRSATNDRCWVELVEVFEHEANSAIYRSVDTTTKNNNQESFVEQPQPAQENPSSGAPVGNKTTTGYGGLFSGTRWG